MKGVIAFFDILGYQSFLQNNSATESALEVLKLITEIPLETKKETDTYWRSSVAKGKAPKSIAVGESLKHIIFSDTIVLIVPYPEDVDEEFQTAAIAFLTIASTRLTAVMFEKGLPLRGVIHEGDYVLKDMCFAGRGIVEAYRWCSQLDFSGFVISPELNTNIERRRGKNGIFVESSYDRFFVTMLSPIKNGSEAHLTHTNWLSYLRGSGLDRIKNDVIQAVMRSFWDHKKDCGREVDAKVRNTCKIMRRLLIAEELRQKDKSAEVKPKP